MCENIENFPKIVFYPGAIPIVFASNDNYIPYMAVMAQSIMENADKNRRYVFYILVNGKIDAANIKLLEKQIANFPQFRIEFVDVGPFIKEYNFYVSRNITVESYFRLLIPYMLSGYKKAVYLDSDMVCRADIAALFDIDLGDKLLGAVHDIAIAYNNNKKGMDFAKNYEVMHNLSNPYAYFNGGLVVFNIELFFRAISFQDLVNIAQSCNWYCHDQDVLNIAAEGRTLILPYHWNYMFRDFAKNLPEDLLKEYNDAQENPNIIHYKPWGKEIYILHFEAFWKYATRTPFIDVIIERMKLSKHLKPVMDFQSSILSSIKHREGIGLKFILIDCVKAWLTRDNNVT
jgi:lipopolysaccharide biosynthesis glycosyltransferase